MTGDKDARWPIWKLAALLYPFAAATVAINLFMLSLMGQAIGLPALSPVATVLISIPLGLPASWGAALWVRRLIDRAEGRRK